MDVATAKCAQRIIGQYCGIMNCSNDHGKYRIDGEFDCPFLHTGCWDTRGMPIEVFVSRLALCKFPAKTKDALKSPMEKIGEKLVKTQCLN